MHIRFILSVASLLAVGAPLPCFGDSIALTCTADGLTTTSCPAIGGLYGSYALADASLDVTVIGNSFSASTDIDVHAVAGSDGIYLFGWATAMSEIDYLASFTTAGAVRQGVVFFSGSAACGHDTGGGPAGAGYAIENGLSGDCYLNSISGSAPITLGQMFSVRMDDEASVVANIDNGGGDSFASSQFQFSVFEDDGVTPVALMDPLATPEPGSFTMLALAAAGIIVWRKSRSAASPGN